MSERLQPGPEVKARIQARPESDFLAFFEELPVDAMQRVARHFPKIDGFRPTSSLGIVRQKAALARKLSRPSANDRDFQSLYLIWREWIYANFKNSSTVQELIDQVEDAAEEAHDDQTRRLAIENKVDALFAKLNEDSRQNLCTREQIERFLTFSPLPETSTARRMIAASKASSDVEYDTKFNELPERLQRVENDVKEATAQLKTMAERVDQNMRAVTQATSDIRELRTTTAQFGQDLGRLRADTQEQGASQGRIADSVTANDKANETRFKAFAEQINELKASIDALRTQAPDIARIDDALARLATMLAEAAERERTSSALVTRLQADLDQLTRDLITFSEDRTLNDKLVTLMARVTDIEKGKAEPFASRPDIGMMAPVSVTANPPSAFCEPLVFKHDAAAVTPIETHTQIVANFSAALQTIGLRKQAAEVFGEECAAAVVARQIVFLKGAFATQAARVLAASLATSTVARLAIPLGLETDSSLRTAVATAFPGTSTEVGALVIEGADMAPIQLLRDFLSDCVRGHRGTALQSRIAVFAAIADGVASIAIEKAYFELGPVFDLDVLDWRIAFAGETTIVPSTFTTPADQRIWELLAQEAFDAEEVTRLARHFASRRDPALDQAVLRAYRALQLIRKRSTVVTPLQSLFYGWLLPYWKTRETTAEEVDEHLDGGKANGSEIDPRLKALLADFTREVPRK